VRDCSWLISQSAHSVTSPLRGEVVLRSKSGKARRPH
jgi:hypothetical protein